MNKETLRKYRDIRKNIKAIKEEIQEIEATLTRCTSILSGMPKGTPKTDKLSDRVSTLLEAKENLIEKELEGLEAILAIEKAIEKLDEREQRIMRLYYINGLTWERVAVEMNYSWQRVHQLHSQILKQICG